MLHRSLFPPAVFRALRARANCFPLTRRDLAYTYSCCRWAVHKHRWTIDHTKRLRLHTSTDESTICSTVFKTTRSRSSTSWQLSSILTLRSVAFCSVAFCLSGLLSWGLLFVVFCPVAFCSVAFCLYPELCWRDFSHAWKLLQASVDTDVCQLSWSSAFSVICRWTSFDFTVISCGQHLSCCGWKLDLSTEIRKLTSTASLSFYSRLYSERSRTSSTSTTHSVWGAVGIYYLLSAVILVVMTKRIGPTAPPFPLLRLSPSFCPSRRLYTHAYCICPVSVALGAY